MSNRNRLRGIPLSAIYIVGLLGIVATGGGGGGGGSDGDLDEPPPPTPPKIAGIWSGTWNGTDPTLGRIAGTWEASVSQNDTGIQGPISFGGDLDCAEGNLDGAADSVTQTVAGVVSRNPCPAADWIFDAFNQDEFFASGNWDKQGTNTGYFEGKRVATFTGPRIKYVHPPGAKAFDYITIVGERLNMDPVNDSLTIGEGGPALVPITISETVITLQLPGIVGDSDHLVLTTGDGKAISPRPLNLDVTTPNTGTTKDIALGAIGLLSEGIVGSINGRRAFVANRGDGSVSMVNVESGSEQTFTVVAPGSMTPVPIHALALDPAGRKVYAAGENVVGVLHAHTAELLRTLTIPASDGGQANPQGIAISPDGRWLLVSEAVDGGRVTVIDVDNDYTVADTLLMTAGSTPRGIATSPDNTHAYIAVSGTDNEIRAYDFATATIDETIAIGSSPAAVAITPDANWLYVTNAPATTVNYYALGTGGSGGLDLGPGVTPKSLAITPDGQNVFVANSSSSVRIINTDTKGVTLVDVGGPSNGVAVGPSGKRAFVTVPSLDKVVEISNQVVLHVSKAGGIANITSTPAGINCGAICVGSFDVGTDVLLSIATDVASESKFVSWNGVAGCGGNPVCSVPLSVPLFVLAVMDAALPGDCFIATAAYGSYLESEVIVLRDFRDRYLLTNKPGRAFVDWYYQKSPPIARVIADYESLRWLTRVVLSPLVYSIKYPVRVGLPTLLFVLLLTGWTGWKIGKKLQRN